MDKNKPTDKKSKNNYADRLLKRRRLTRQLYPNSTRILTVPELKLLGVWR